MKEIKTTKTLVDRALHETKSHGTEDFPIGVYLDDFSNFENGFICWHWHEEVQLTYILEGAFQLQIESQCVTLQQGDMIFINSGLLHQIRPTTPCTGKLYSMIWRGRLISGGIHNRIYKNYVLPLLQSDLRYLLYREGDEKGQALAGTVEQIIQLYMEEPPFYDMKMLQHMTALWMQFYEEFEWERESEKRRTGQEGNSDGHQERAGRGADSRDEMRVKKALQYMQEHFSENITLPELAKVLSISKTELCRDFRRILATSPKEYLLSYRIREATVLLKNKELKIADIAEMTGFNSPSHFGTYFLKYMGCTPGEYRRNRMEQYE